MADSDKVEFDFDSWSKLAADDPASFEAMRQAAIEECIAKATPEQQVRLRSLQWRIEQERRQAKTPLAACMRISRMMWERLAGSGGLLEHLQAIQNGWNGRDLDSLQPAVSESRAKIVPFSRQDGAG